MRENVRGGPVTWDRCVVTVDRVRLFDQFDVQMTEWSDHLLFSNLIFAGVPINYDEYLRDVIGYADHFDLFIDSWSATVLAHARDAELKLVRLDVDTTRAMLALYRAYRY